MPVMKFHSFEEAERSLWCFNPTPDYYKRVSVFFELFCRLSQPSYPKGILNISALMMPTNRNLNGTSPVQCRKDNGSKMLPGKNIILTGEYMIVKSEKAEVAKIES
ncbi:MAG: hypothetical protein NT178_17810 [Proteobacteria bacterium]|nr:hypothetical protein [Pseudomonadota bacterium]